MTPTALARMAVARSLFAPTDLASAIATLGFVQADPIRAPARAQDLILRHRVVGYRAGDLERDYPGLPVVEEMLHVYGFLHRDHRALLHPRRVMRRWNVEDQHPRLSRAIVAHLRSHGASHPRAVEQGMFAGAVLHPDRASIVNGWGGVSNATTRMLDVLHYRGLVHVARRDSGVRVFEAIERSAASLTPRQRADGLILLLAALYAPLPEASLMQIFRNLTDRGMSTEPLRARVPLLVKRGRLALREVDGIGYLWPDDGIVDQPMDEPTVRFLAPFDPIVWDRRRFEHLWGWAYRFEAYVPPARRRLGYYALPLLFDRGDDPRVIGWVNLTVAGTGRPVVDEHHVDGTRPRARAYRIAFDAEVARLEAFLSPRP